MFDHVPPEVRACPQWLVWRLKFNEQRGKWDKLPLSPHTGQVSSVTSRETWSTFDHAVNVVQNYGAEHNIAGIGFVLGYDSGIVGIDLDGVLTTDGKVLSSALHDTADVLNSYTELSPSGTGLHVLVKAQFAGGRRADGVEVYGQGRFFTITGRPYGTPRPLAERQSHVEKLVADIDARRTAAAPPPVNWLAPERIDDGMLYRTAAEANNGQKFIDLWEGRFYLHYTSQSEADYSLINILGHYCDAPAQISRMFHQSALGQRDKAMRSDYVSNMIARSQDRKAPLVTLPPIPTTPIDAVVAHATHPVYNDAPVFDEDEAEDAAARADKAFNPPGGMVEVIANWFWQQSIYPMEEVALIGALGLIAGICGRQYQFQKQGLNLYMLLLAETGAGKDALGTGMSRIFDAVANNPPEYVPNPANLGAMPAARHFQGPSRLSGKGLLRKFQDSDTLSMVSVLPEFSQTITSMAHKNANEGLRDFQHALLEFYTKSAHGATYAGSMNADKAKDIAPLASPAFTMLCEGTPGRFYKALNEDMITDGLMARFIVIEREGYADHNPSYSQFAAVPDAIKSYVMQLCQHVMQLKVNGDARINVQMTPDAENYSESLRESYRKRGITASSDVHKYLWLRAHQNLMRMAALVAVGDNAFHPVVNIEQIRWADRIIRRQCTLIVGKFRRGEVGQSDTADGDQYAALVRLLQKWLELSALRMRQYPAHYAEAKAQGIVPYGYLQAQTQQAALFKHDRRGATAALKAVVASANSTGLLTKVRLSPTSTIAGEFYKISI